MEAYTSPLRNGGRPTKKTAARCKLILDGIKAGWPYLVACNSAHIAYETFKAWCKQDAEFAARVAAAEAESIKTNLELIQAAARDKQWPAAAWLLERRHPELFSRPEVQLSVGVQNNIALAGGRSENAEGTVFETVIVSDLEFLGLRRSGRYEYHGAASEPVREIEAETVSVPAELSGSLSRPDHPGCDVISDSQAKADEAQAETVRERVRAMYGQRGVGTSASEEQGKGESDERPITLPADGALPSSAWWDQLVRSADDRAIERHSAIAVCRLVLTALVGQERAARVPLDFEGEDELKLGDIFAALEELTGGPNGWRTLLKFAGHAQAQD